MSIEKRLLKLAYAEKVLKVGQSCLAGLSFRNKRTATQAWQARDVSMDLSAYQGVDARDQNAMTELNSSCRDPDGGIRHSQWLDAIQRGVFSFGATTLTYAPKGTGSWKAAALGTLKTKDSGLEIYPYSDAFLGSNWKLFHDAIQVHRSDVVHEILPRYGICAA